MEPLFRLNHNIIETKPQMLAQNRAHNLDGLIEKSGNNYGMSSYIAYVPSTSTGVVVLTNKD